MTERDDARIFISYSRKDGAEFAAGLRRDLEAEGFSIWQDLVALEGGRDWWSQIEDALKSKALQHFILVVTVGALKSPVVRREIRLARQEGKTVCPVKGPGLGDLAAVPRWLGQLYELDVPEHRTTLRRILELPSRQKRVPAMAPEPPADFIVRKTEFDALKRQLLDAKGDAVAITAALKGAGGYGKTTLAKALAHDPDIQDAYFDGILWVELGEQGSGRIVTLISDLAALLTGTRPAVATVEGARAALAEALGDRRILLIVDDVWRAQDLNPFLQGGKNTTRLITTRLDRVVPDKAFRQTVDAMTEAQATDLLAAGLPPDRVHVQREALTRLSVRLGEWALLVKLVNGFLRQRAMQAKEPLERAIAGVNRRLDEKGLTAFDAKSEQDRSNAVAHTIGVSLQLLTEESRSRFRELGIFPEDVDVPVEIVARLWGRTGDLDEFETEDLLGELYGLSLLLTLDMDERTLRLHDTVRHFLQHDAGRDGLTVHHKRLVQALGQEGTDSAGELAKRYFYLYLPYHLAAAGERGRLDDLLIDPGWLVAKLAATRSPQALVADYEQHGTGKVHTLIGRTLRLTAGICARDPRQLIPQLIGRLMALPEMTESGLLERAAHRLPRPCLLPKRPALTPPGAETARFEGHELPVTALCLLPDGRLASASRDRTVRLWDVAAGVETARLEGHMDRVMALCVLPDGRLASASYDRTVRLWDISTGLETARFVLRGLEAAKATTLCVLPEGRLAVGGADNIVRLWNIAAGSEIGRLEGHTRRITALCTLPDGRLASGSRDRTVRLWDVGTGAEISRIDGHDGGVAALCALPDGRLASGSDDHMVRLWDLGADAETVRLVGHIYSVTVLCALPGGRLASGSWDRTIRIWDTAAGTEIACLEGHTYWVTALCLLPDGRLASGSRDRTVRLWDPESWSGTSPGSWSGASRAAGAPASRSGKHDRGVTALLVLPGRRVASASGDKTVRLWDAATGAETARLTGHDLSVTSLCLLADGQLASGSTDNTIRLWNTAAGTQTARIVGHGDSVKALCVLPDGRLASGSEDRTVRLWDLVTGAETMRFKGHDGPVTAVCVLPDGRLASSSEDKTIRLWNTAAGAQTARLQGHDHWVTSLCLLPDGRLASGSDDETVRLWDISTGTEIACLEGHDGWVMSLCALPGGRLASGSWNNTVRVWDLATCTEIARLELDATVLSLAALPDGRTLVAGDALGRLHWLEPIL